MVQSRRAHSARALRSQRLSIAAAPAALAALGAATSAQAATYCVSDAACVAAGGSAEPTIQAALADAANTKVADTVRIGARTLWTMSSLARAAR